MMTPHPSAAATKSLAMKYVSLSTFSMSGYARYMVIQISVIKLQSSRADFSFMNATLWNRVTRFHNAGSSKRPFCHGIAISC